jgi:hypothetical protein
MKHFFLLIFSVFLLNSVYTQNYSSQNPDYIFNAKAGERTLNAELYDSCIIYFKNAFEIQQTSFLSTLRAAACGYSGGKFTYFKEQLEKALDINWDGTKNIFYSYPEFAYLHGTGFENDLNELWTAAAEASGVNVRLMQELEQMRITDQKERLQMRSVQEEFGRESVQMDSLWKLQSYSDSVNTVRIVEILEEYGYPGKTMVGPAQASSAFLIVQHAELEIQEKYMDLITAAADADEVPWASVALLVDRVNMRNGKAQKYASQISIDPETGEHYFSEIENPEKIDSIRATVGLGPIQAYADNWDIQWDVEKHKKKVAEMKAKSEDK